MNDNIPDDELPAAKGHVRITNADGDVLGVVNDYPEMTVTHMLIHMAVGLAVLKVAELLETMASDTNAPLEEVVLAEIMLTYFARVERSDREILLSPPKQVIEKILDICNEQTDRLVNMGFQITPLIGATTITLVIRTTAPTQEELPVEGEVRG